MSLVLDVPINPDVTNRLERALRRSRLPHGIIISGQAGMGKMKLAKALAKSLQCSEEQVDEWSCGRCVSCLAFEADSHPDVFYVKPTKTKALGVADVREQIVLDLEIMPHYDGYKIYIIENAHTMTVPAQNALLKTIEEPYSHGVFILLCENTDGLLPTVLSRCVEFSLKPVDEEQITGFLTREKGISHQEAAQIAAFSEGNPGRALSLSGPEFLNMRDEITGLMDSLIQRQGDVMAAFNAAKTMESHKESISGVFTIMSAHFRDMVAQRQSRLPYHRIFDILDGVFLAQRQIAQNGNFMLVLECLALKIVGI